MFTPEEEKQFKEILYLLLEKVRATKAAFYLTEPNGSFQLVASYGFTRTDRFAERLLRTDPLATAVYEHREPRYVNDIKSAGALQAAMEGASSARILTAPLYLDGRIAGILDVRDKAGREPFLPDDLLWANEVLRRLAVRVRAIPRFSAAAVQSDDEMTIERFGSGTISVPPRTPEGGPGSGDASSPGSSGRASLAVAGLDELPTSHLPSGTARTMRLVEETLATRAGARTGAGARGSSEREATFHRLFLETCLFLPDVELAALSRFAPAGVEIAVAARRPLGEDVEPALVENLEKVFARSGVGFGAPTARRVRLLFPAAAGAAPLSRNDIAAIQSSVLHASRDEAEILTLVFRHGPGAESREGLKSVHLLVKSSLEEIRGAIQYRDAYKSLVNKLLEPGLKKYAGLKVHSFNVGRMARKFATYLRLPALEVEQVTVAGILHDVGMKDLNYEELYTKRTLNDEEIKLLREHARVGAFLLEEIPWPYPVAPLVKHHHERWDGAGYPDGLRAEEIPLGARIIHLCEAFDAMTSATSYRAVISAYQALDILASKGGTQFDPELAPAFKKMVEGIKHP